MRAKGGKRRDYRRRRGGKPPPVQVSAPRDSVIIRRAYASSAWVKARARKVRAAPLCEDCLEAGEARPTDEVHHILPLRDGGALVADNNLRALCKSCHRSYEVRETMWRAGKPGAYGADSDGNPINHPGGVHRDSMPQEVALWKAFTAKGRRHGGKEG